MLMVKLLHNFDLSQQVLHGAVGKALPSNAFYCHQSFVTALIQSYILCNPVWQTQHLWGEWTTYSV